MTKLTHKRLLEVLRYDPETGEFRRLIPMQCRGKVGELLGCVVPSGYVRIGIDGEQIYAHRLAWFYMHGSWPQHHIDHIDGDRENNRLCNLRDVSQRINLQNRRALQASGKLLGTSFCRRTSRWRATIRTDGKQRSLGYFNSEQEAHQRYLDAKRQLHAGCTI